MMVGVINGFVEEVQWEEVGISYLKVICIGWHKLSEEEYLEDMKRC